ncbi:MAG: hypothetical protein AB1443_01050 [Pseudomonadota bacterium]
MTGSPKQDKRSQLLDDIEAFSLNGPPACDEGPAMPIFTREKLSFPDLSQAAPEPKKNVAKAVAERAAGLTVASSQTATGSLLDRLKQQAQTVQRTSVKRDADEELRAFQLSASLGAGFHYLNDLIKQLNIIKPAVPKEFVFAGSIGFSGMSWVEGAADFRMLPTATEDRLYETMTVRFRLSGPRQLQVERDALGVEPLRKMLHDANISFQLEERKNRRSQVESGLFTIPCELKAGFLLKADYETNDLVLRTRNIDRFGMMEFRLQAGELTQATLDDLAQMMIGQESRFLKRFRRSA